MNYVNDEKTLANFADNDKFYSDRMENRISPESSLWNPWHGCHKLSTGCRHCYVYRGDSKHGKDSSIITKTGQFNLPVRRKKDKTYKIPSGNLVYTCFTSDFLIEEADEWRIYKPQNKMFHFCKTFCSKITLVNTIQNVILNPI